MNTAYLLIGGNIGERLNNLAAARNLLQREIGNIIKRSSVYETASWGIEEQPDFLNQVLVIETKLPAQYIIKKILSVEEQMGRTRTQKNASRVIDIDILFFNDEVIDEADLTIPHPEIQNRKFVLVPLSEVSPNMMHPVLRKSILRLLSTCHDHLEVKLFDSPPAA